MAAVLLRKCCSSSAWVEEMVVHRPYQSFEEIKKAAYITNKEMSPTDWQEGFNGVRIIEYAPDIQQLEEQYYQTFAVPYFIDQDLPNATAPSHIVQELTQALTSDKSVQQKLARTRFMKITIRNLANVLAALGDNNKPVGFHQSSIESSLLQMDVVPQLDSIHPSRAKFWNGTRLKGLLEWEYKEKDVDLWGGLNYHKKLPAKPNHVNHSYNRSQKQKHSIILISHYALN